MKKPGQLRSSPLPPRRERMKTGTKPLKARGEGKAKKEARYAAFIRSPEWKAIRRKAIKAASHQCQQWKVEMGISWRCRETSHLEVHHQTYARFGGAELLEDLLVLCRWCHRAHHATNGKARVGKLTRIADIVPDVLADLVADA